MLRKMMLILVVLAMMALMFGCSDRGVTSVDDNYPNGVDYTDQHTFPAFLERSMFSDVALTTLVRFRVYVPNSYQGQNSGTPFPVLYLLSPMGEDEFFYLDHGLKDVADKLIADGKIKPMIIVCVNGSNGYGGSFYGSSPAGGQYDQLFGGKFGDAVSGSLIPYVDRLYNTDTLRSGRAISGVGMGGYGAMRIALKFSQNFSSASAVSAPLDFDGSGGSGGFIPLFQQLITDARSDALVRADSIIHYRDSLRIVDTILTPIDTAFIRDSVRSKVYVNLDTSYARPLQTMFFAAAASFSPHDTGLVGDGNVITDSATFFNPEGTIKLHLPFDSNGAAYTPIWNLWLANNLENMIPLYPNSLDSVRLMLLASPQADYGFYQQTTSFRTTLQGLPNVHLTYTEYSGYSGYPADKFHVVYDLLQNVLEFHSDNFVGL
jgi:hypothetical protein